jgi:hypothetical protein
MKTEVIVPDEVLEGVELDTLSDAIVEYITNKTGYCVQSLSYSIEVVYDLDEGEALFEKEQDQ